MYGSAYRACKPTLINIAGCTLIRFVILSDQLQNYNKNKKCTVSNQPLRVTHSGSKFNYFPNPSIDLSDRLCFSIYSSVAAERRAWQTDSEHQSINKRQTVGAARQTDCVFLSRPAPLLSHRSGSWRITVGLIYIVCVCLTDILSMLLEIRFIFTASLFLLLAMKC